MPFLIEAYLPRDTICDLWLGLCIGFLSDPVQRVTPSCDDDNPFFTRTAIVLPYRLITK